MKDDEFSEFLESLMRDLVREMEELLSPEYIERQLAESERINQALIAELSKEFPPDAY
jgi:hypothetical protein